MVRKYDYSFQRSLHCSWIGSHQFGIFFGYYHYHLVLAGYLQQWGQHVHNHKPQSSIN